MTSKGHFQAVGTPSGGLFGKSWVTETTEQNQCKNENLGVKYEATTNTQV
jgi:hypothetical protein